MIRSGGWDLEDGISAFIRKDTESLLLSLPLAMEGHDEKMAICRPGRGPSLRTESASTLILDFSVSATEKNECSLFKPPSP